MFEYLLIKKKTVLSLKFSEFIIPNIKVHFTIYHNSVSYNENLHACKIQFILKSKMIKKNKVTKIVLNIKTTETDKTKF